MSHVLSNLFVRFYHRVLRNHLKTPTDLEVRLYTYSATHLYQLSILITTDVASLLPIAGVVVLYFVANILARLDIIAGFTAVFHCFCPLQRQLRRLMFGWLLLRTLHFRSYDSRRANHYPQKEKGD